MKASMKSSLLGLAITVTVVPVICMIGFIALMGTDVVKTANTEFRASALDSARQSTTDIRQMCDVIQIACATAAASAETAIFSELKKFGTVSISKTEVGFTAYPDSFPDDKRSLRAKVISFGGKPLTPDPSSELSQKMSETLARIKERLHCDVGIISKIPASDLFVRSATTMTNPTGESAEGALVSCSDGGEVGAMLRAMDTERIPVSGIVSFGGFPFSANYVPLFDADGNVAGALYYGFRINLVSELEKSLQSSPIGETGSVWIIDDSNRLDPVLRISRDSAAGTSVAADPLEQRRAFLQRIVEKSRVLRDGDVGVETVSIADKKERREIVRLVTYTYYKPWNWIIGTSLDADEFSGSESALVGQIETFSRKIIYAGIVFTLLAIGIAWILAEQMSKPLKVLTKIARFHSQGDMAAAENAARTYRERGGSRVSEFDSLMEAVSDMTRGLSELVGGVRADGEKISEIAARISSTANLLESCAAAGVESMKRVSAVGREISAKSDSINKEARMSAVKLERTLAAAREWNETLSALKRNYDALYAAAEAVMGRLSLIGENAEKVTEVVVAIGDVNRRTNLLSLNASIEAEKAGEAGLGFAVVARQIRRLADKTSKAAEEIENAVRQMQSTVNSGVMEMDRFGANMRQSLKIIIETANSLSQVVAGIEGVGPRFENIAGRIAALSESARGIGETMSELLSASLRARESVAEFKSATSMLDTASAALIGEVSRFKISEGVRR